MYFDYASAKTDKVPSTDCRLLRLEDASNSK